MHLIWDFTQLWGSVLFILATVTVGAGGQVPGCPEEATSCCQCVTRPMCAWTDTPLNSTRPRCTSLLLSNIGHHALVNDLLILQSRPFNPHRKRYLRPQRAKLTMALGVRREIHIGVVARTRRVRLTILGPVDAPEFDIAKGDELSCARRFRRRLTTRHGTARRGSQRNGRPIAHQKRITIDCIASAVGAVQSLKLIVDMNKCYESTKEIRINVRERGSRRFKLDIDSSCKCSCQSADMDDTQDACQEGEETRQCTNDREDTNENHCSGVNGHCSRDEYGPTCSGHGTCVCGGCVCDHVTHVSTGNDANDDTATVLDDAVHTTPHYTGAYCECDDASCPKHNDQVCGGPDQGACQCGHCACREGFYGDACEQAVSEETCIGPNRLVCNNQGNCVYGRCACLERYTGHYCQDCPTCPSMCTRLSPCILCIVSSQSENPRSDCESECNTFHNNQISFVPVTDEWPDMVHFCETTTQNNCTLNFAYETQDNWDIVAHYSTDILCPN